MAYIGLKVKIILKNGKMRKRFEQQMSLGIIPISEKPYSIKSRDATVKLTVALLEIYNNVDYNEKNIQYFRGIFSE